MIGWLERAEAQRRASDAARVALIAAAMDQTVGDPSGAAARASGPGPATELAYRSLRAELATAFRISEYEAERQMDLAHRLSHQYVETLSALDRAEISYAHARIVASAGMVIGAADTPELRRRRAGYEQEVLEIAVRETPGRLRPIARRLAERWAERTLDERHREAVAERRVCIIDGEDGMAELFARLPALEAHAIYDRLTRIARAAEHGERRVPARGETPEDEVRAALKQETSAEAPAARTRDQLRADALADLLLSSDEFSLFAGSTGESVRASVQVIVSGGPGQAGRPGQAGQRPEGEAPRADGEGTDSAEGTGNAEHADSTDFGGDIDLARDAELVGFGPIDGATAGRIASETGRWSTVVLESATGRVLSVDRYRPSEQMRRMLGARDRHCRFPGCRVPVSRCDLDHTVDAALGGPTATDNLAHLCRGHHVLKHHTQWRVSQDSGGALRWRSPTGREYVDRPPGAVLAGARRTVRFVGSSEPGF
ncbi:DUF222 domain-containing protein [Leucobacter sp. CSA1]|uniref:DUF222 domain-containing protein n=1 Tax=Leucobacter chromiisoli TaxID=2796471 RepID=A0A934Q5H8_9MICO|nr:DUF222 domain-containing protein [Leucobacter chromiisoli]